MSCSKDQNGFSCGKISTTKKSTDAELWLNMMKSMMNFAMASTSLMKGIQNRIAVTEKSEKESEEKQIPKVIQNVSNIFSNDVSLLSVPIAEDFCVGKTCDFKHKPKDQTNGLPSRLPVLIKNKGCLGTAEETKPIWKDCRCPGKDNPESAEDKAVKEDCVCVKEECVEDSGSRENITEGAVVEESVTKCGCCHSCEFDDRSEVSEDSSQTDSDTCNETNCNLIVRGSEEGDDVIRPLEETCSCQTEVEEQEEEEIAPSEFLDCECQTSTEEIMVKELQLANLAYQLRLTEENLKGLKKEMDRITNCVYDKKKEPDEIAVAIYQEIMKPRISIAEVIASRRSPRRSSRRENVRQKNSVVQKHVIKL
ncbi:hypothetical protein HHI36_009263 [Cryptolaemus montrouzieri]|uniref:Uncharacterized protein n=1 Tax=Cryptolaemus montrouzieri TaxID=559131 RepID=A0ABD2MVE2_9CUCU